MATVDTLITRFVTQGDAHLEKTFQALSKGADTYEEKMERTTAIGDRFIGAGVGIAGAVALIGVNSLKAAGEMQQVEAGFTSMLGSADAAQAKIKEIQEFAKNSPFDFKESAKGAQRLLAMGFAADQLLPTMKAVGNAVAAAGGGTEEFNGVLTALGQIQSKGKVSAEELMQMAERGIPVFQILEKQLGLTKDQLGNIGNEGIQSEKGIAALVKGMQELAGGTGMTEQMKTIPGQISSLVDSFGQLNTAIGETFTGEAGGAIQALTTLIDKGTEFTKNNPEIVKAGLLLAGIGAGATIAYGAYLKVSTAINLAKIAKQGLKTATVADDIAEVAKTRTAIAEGAAIKGVGDSAVFTAGKMANLAKMAGWAGLAAASAYLLWKAPELNRDAVTKTDEEMHAEGPLEGIIADAANGANVVGRAWDKTKRPYTSGTSIPFLDWARRAMETTGNLGSAADEINQENARNASPNKGMGGRQNAATVPPPSMTQLPNGGMRVQFQPFDIPPTSGDDLHNDAVAYGADV